MFVNSNLKAFKLNRKPFPNEPVAYDWNKANNKLSKLFDTLCETHTRSLKCLCILSIIKSLKSTNSLFKLNIPPTLNQDIFEHFDYLD